MSSAIPRERTTASEQPPCDEWHTVNCHWAPSRRPEDASSSVVLYGPLVPPTLSAAPCWAGQVGILAGLAKSAIHSTLPVGKVVSGRPPSVPATSSERTGPARRRGGRAGVAGMTVAISTSGQACVGMHRWQACGSSRAAPDAVLHPAPPHTSRATRRAPRMTSTIRDSSPSWSCQLSSIVRCRGRRCPPAARLPRQRGAGPLVGDDCPPLVAARLSP